MRATTPGFIGERLTQARKARGLTAVTLADLLGVTSTTISQYEHNKQAPRPDLMLALSEALNLPVAFFKSPISTPDGERRTKWRSNTSATKFARERAESRYEWLREIVGYFESFMDFPNVNIPKIDVPSNFREISDDLIDKVAKEARIFYGLGNAPIQDLVLVLENNGIIVARGKLNAEALNAFSEWLDNDYPYIFLGTDKNVCARSRFDAAHELGHLILHRNVPKRQYGTPADFKLLEQQAHRFAGAFLLPPEQFFKELWAPTLNAFESLKGRWKVSIKCMIVQSNRHGLLSESQYQRMMINYNRKWKTGEPLDDVLQIESPRLLTRCVEMLINEKIKTKEDILLDIPLSPTDIEELTNLPFGFFKEAPGEVVEMIQPQLRKNSTHTANDGNVIPFHRNL